METEEKGEERKGWDRGMDKGAGMEIRGGELAIWL